MMSYIQPISYSSYQNNAPQSIQKKNKKFYKNEVNPSYKFIQPKGLLNCEEQPKASKMLMDQKVKVISSMKANFSNLSLNPSTYTNSFDDGQGVFFSYSMTYLFKCVNDIVEELKNEDVPFEFKSEQVAYFIKLEIQKFFLLNSHAFFLAAFQTCLYLPIKYQNPVWQLLAKGFIDNSFENISPFIHTLHKLTFSEKKPFISILSFLNMLSFIYHGNTLLPISNHEKDSRAYPVEMSYQTSSRVQSWNSNLISAIHLKTNCDAVTLEIPLDLLAAIHDFEKITDTGLLKTLVPKPIEAGQIKYFLESLIKENIIKNSLAANFAKHLVSQSDPEILNSGFRMLLCCIDRNKIDLNFFKAKVTPQLEDNDQLTPLSNVDILAITEFGIKKIMSVPIKNHFDKGNIDKIDKLFRIYFQMLKRNNDKIKPEYFEYYCVIDKINNYKKII